eukprot:Skav226890  [mRNA]  locus=scaffold1187:577942:578709:+ [translate_table: standard]
MECDSCQDVDRWTALRHGVPRPLATNCKYIPLLFSSHRRPHDIACCLQWKTSLQPMCVDTAVDCDPGNIFNSHLWIDLIKTRKVLGAHAAPPCESYSMATWIPWDAPDQPAPRPFRDTNFPWGLTGCTYRQAIQCLLGNVLIMRATILLTMVFGQAGAISLEHPKGVLEKQQAWSICDRCLVKYLLHSPAIRLFAFLQGPPGRPFSKPTTPLYGRLDDLPRAMYAAYQPGWRPVGDPAWPEWGRHSGKKVSSSNV